MDLHCFDVLLDLRLFLDPDAILAVARWGALIVKWTLSCPETSEVGGASPGTPRNSDSWKPSAPRTSLTGVDAAHGQMNGRRKVRQADNAGAQSNVADLGQQI